MVSVDIGEISKLRGVEKSYFLETFFLVYQVLRLDIFWKTWYVFLKERRALLNMLVEVTLNIK
jgi:hypothetical protein